MKKLGLYEWSVFLFFVVLPILTLVVEYCLFGAIIDIDLILKWITFYYVGCRLFSAGVKQLISPEFTLNEIFHIKEKGAYGSAGLYCY